MKEKIPKRLTRCAAGDEPFTPGSEYVSLLKSTDEGWERADYCPKCWEQEKRGKYGPFWRGKIPLKKEKRHSPDEQALELFRRTEDPKLLSVLALYLHRRDQIARRSETYYEIPETGEVVVVPKMRLSPEEGRKAGEQLVRLLNELS
ncbi:MAG: hypothetical protein JJU12_07225 [Chlamydiales bacterium]|nr:hypothetical protein [Chlamydiales bacterium]